MEVQQAKVLYFVDYADFSVVQDVALHGEDYAATLSHFSDVFMYQAIASKWLEQGLRIFALVSFSYLEDISGENLEQSHTVATEAKPLTVPLDQWYETNIRSPLTAMIRSSADYSKGRDFQNLSNLYILGVK